MSFCLLNARYVCDVKQAGKAALICNVIEDNDIDMLTITETWLSAEDSVSTGRITPAGYKLSRERTALAVVAPSSTSLAS